MAETKTILTDETGVEIRDILAEIRDRLENSSIKNLNTMSWDEIDEICAAGDAESTFHIGQTKDAVINGEDVTLRIIDFNHDDLTDAFKEANPEYNGGCGKAAITWKMVDSFKSTRTMNVDCWDNDPDDGQSNIGGWRDSQMRTETVASIYSSLDSKIKAVAKPVIKKTGMGGANNDSLYETEDYLFLLSCEEIYGTDSPYYNSSSAAWTQWTAKGEGYQYRYFAQFDDMAMNMKNSYGYDKNGYRRTRYYQYKQIFEAISQYGKGNKSQYTYTWLRSPYLTNRYSFVYVDNYGNVYSDDSDNSNGVSLGFCT